MMPLQNSFRSNHFLPSGYGCTKGELWSKNHQRRNEMKQLHTCLQGVSAKETDLE
jgi:hypothetical protein